MIKYNGYEWKKKVVSYHFLKSYIITIGWVQISYSNYTKNNNKDIFTFHTQQNKLNNICDQTNKSFLVEAIISPPLYFVTIW